MGEQAARRFYIRADPWTGQGTAGTLRRVPVLSLCVIPSSIRSPKLPYPEVSTYTVKRQVKVPTQRADAFEE